MVTSAPNTSREPFSLTKNFSIKCDLQLKNFIYKLNNGNY
jgi:hypothetical protein